MALRVELTVLHEQIESRCRSVLHERESWPCRKGCDLCCRSLAALPSLTAPEWELLWDGIRSLPPETRDEVIARVERFRRSRQPGPVVCPFLNEATGACQVYAHRPVACRAYGFYVEREKGLYCGPIESDAASGKLQDVIWGNYAGVERSLEAFGGKIGLLEWFAAQGSLAPQANPGSASS